MKEIILMIALIIVASTNANAIPPAGCPPVDAVEQSIRFSKSQLEFERSISSQGYPPEKLYMLYAPRLPEWTKIQEIVRKERLVYSGSLCDYHNSQFGVTLMPK